VIRVEHGARGQVIRTATATKPLTGAEKSRRYRERQAAAKALVNIDTC
jgi:hypothetical protein